MKYKIYLHNLLNETVEESGDVINPNPNNRVLNESPRDLRIRQNLAVDEEESKIEGSYLHSEINNANSQHIILLILIRRENYKQRQNRDKSWNSLFYFIFFFEIKFYLFKIKPLII